MRTLPPENFPPIGTVVIEKTDRRVVLLHGAYTEKLELAIWLRRVERVAPTVLGGWYCSPDGGLSLTRESANTLLSALTEALRKPVS